MIKIGPVEQRMYELRQEHPLVIPQIDPSSLSIDSVEKIFKHLESIGICHIALGGSIVDKKACDMVLELAVKDFDFSVSTYLNQGDLAATKNYPGRTALYWMSVLNAENMYFLRDVLVMSSIAVSKCEYETIPTAYVFDERGSLRTATWLSRPTPVPREKPCLSLSLALAAQYCGFRFYIMGGGSGVPLPPPKDHVSLLSEKTELFVMPTSGITTASQAKEMFENGADAIHIGNLIEKDGGLKVLTDMITASSSFPGKNFL